ncbi:MAG: hypothetical protein Q4D58_00730 [Synergistaceae bacterium]|nr:hypothetical protein [Synergistaceae bacterium]
MREQIIHDRQDLTWLSWSKIRNSSGTAGSFLKAYSDLGGEKTYYKLSNYDAVRGIIGHECVNELIADRLLTILGIEHLSYQLIHAEILIDGKLHETWLCASGDFKRRGESKLALDAFYQAERLEGELPLDFCLRYGWDEYIWRMLAVDYLILNRDRHGANIEVLRNSRKKTLRLAPLFDHGLSLIFNCHDEAAASAADVAEDKPVQCFVGSRSAWENLKLIPPGKMPPFCSFQERDRERLFAGLDMAVAKLWLDKIWEMLWLRRCVYEDFRNKG